MPDSDDVSGKCILVVEDDYLLAREICNDLKGNGASVLGPAPTVHYARLLLGKRRIDGAVLDIKLFGEDVYQLVDSLLGQKIPVVFTTSYERAQIAEKYRFIDTLHKPICLKSLRSKIATFRPLPGQVASLMSESSDGGRAGAREACRSTVTLSDRWSLLMVRMARGSDRRQRVRDGR